MLPTPPNPITFMEAFGFKRGLIGGFMVFIPFLDELFGFAFAPEVSR
jgi:hypothetical protein